MKFASSLLVTSLAFASYCNAAALVALDVGVLANESGVAIPDGALVQVIASTSDTAFSAPTPGSFTGGSLDDVVVATLQMASNTTGVPGLMSTTFQLRYETGFYGGRTVSNGTPLLLRWWPSNVLSPGVGDRFGEFRTASVQDDATRAWTAGPDGQNENLKFLTNGIGGSNADTAGRASLAVVPEPSSAVLAVAGGLAMLVRRRRK